MVADTEHLKRAYAEFQPDVMWYAKNLEMVYVFQFHS